jgi:hypothetical protein
LIDHKDLNRSSSDPFTLNEDQIAERGVIAGESAFAMLR